MIIVFQGYLPLVCKRGQSTAVYINQFYYTMWVGLQVGSKHNHCDLSVISLETSSSTTSQKRKSCFCQPFLLPRSHSRRAERATGKTSALMTQILVSLVIPLSFPMFVRVVAVGFSIIIII